MSEKALSTKKGGDMKSRYQVLFAIGFTVVFFLAVLFIIEVSVAKKAVSGMSDIRIEKNEYEPADFGLTGEEISAVSQDGLVIHAYLFRSEADKGTVLILHGMHGMDATSLFGHAKFLNGAGYNAVCVDMRAHGGSGGRSISFGYKEPYDVMAILEKLKTTGASGPYLLYGLSMGASTAIRTAAANDEVGGVIAVSPFASMERQIDDYMKAMKLPAVLRAAMKPAFYLVLRVKFGMCPRLNSPEHDISGTDAPILIIHGTADKQVPYYHSELLMERGGDNCSLWTVDGADHLIVDDVLSGEAVEYREKVIAFFDAIAAAGKGV